MSVSRLISALLNFYVFGCYYDRGVNSTFNTCAADGDVFSVRAVIDTPRFKGAVEEAGLRSAALNIVQPDGTSPSPVEIGQHDASVTRLRGRGFNRSGLR